MPTLSELLENADVEVTTEASKGRFVAGFLAGAAAIGGLCAWRKIRQAQRELDEAEAEVVSGGSTAGADEADNDAEV